MANPNQPKDPNTGRFIANGNPANNQSYNGNPANSGFSFSNIFSSWLSGTTARVNSWLTGLLASLTSGLLNLLRTLFTNIFNGIFSTIRTVFTGGLAALSAALALSVGGMIAAFKSATDAMSSFSKSALEIRAGTGLSYGAAGNLLTRGRAFGMSESETVGAFGNQNPFIASIRGNNYQSPNYLSNLSREYNAGMSQGPLGLLLTQAMFKARGIPDSVRNIAAMDPSKVSAQERWVNNIGPRLGVSGADIKKWAEDVFFASNKVSTILHLLKLRLAAVVTPQLVAGLEKVADWFGRNSKRITSVLERTATALSNILLRGLEIVLKFLEKNAGKIEEWFWKAFTFLLRDVPVGFMRASATIMRALSFVLEAFSAGASWLVQQVPTIQNFFNALTAGFLNAIPDILRAGHDLETIIGGVANAIRNITGQLREITGQGGGTGGNDNGSGNGGRDADTSAGARAGQAGNATVGFLTRALQWLGSTGRTVGNQIGLTTGDPNGGGIVNQLFNGWVGYQIASRLAPPLIRLGGRLIGSGIGALFTRGAATAAGAAATAMTGGAAAISPTAQAVLGGAAAAGGRSLLARGALFAAGPAGQILTLGGAIGAYAYDNIRGYGGKNLPSSGQIASYYWNRLRGNSPIDAARITLGANPLETDPRAVDMRGVRLGHIPNRYGAADLAQARVDFANQNYPHNSLPDLLGRGAVGGNGLLQNGLGLLEKYGPQLSNGLANSANFLSKNADSLDISANNYAAKFDELIAATKDTTKAVKDGTDSEKENAKRLGLAHDILSRTLAYNAQDAALAVVR